jgi:restriction system protein
MALTLYFFGGAVCILWAILFRVVAGEEVMPFAGVGAAVGVFLLVMGMIVLGRTSRAEDAAREFINSQARLFGRKRAQLVFKDDYGIEKTDGWEKEKRHILSTVIPDYLRKVGHSQSAIQSLNSSSNATLRILTALEEAAVREGSKNTIANFSDVASGIGYEQFCAERLRAAGWGAHLTKATGDQGTDIIAEHNGRRIVIQCKFYTSPVGNKAVQEVVAARLHERADIAVVVSNASRARDRAYPVSRCGRANPTPSRTGDFIRRLAA